MIRWFTWGVPIEDPVFELGSMFALCICIREVGVVLVLVHGRHVMSVILFLFFVLQIKLLCSFGLFGRWRLSQRL